jgi:hypothetical protein
MNDKERKKLQDDFIRASRQDVARIGAAHRQLLRAWCDQRRARALRRNQAILIALIIAATIGLAALIIPHTPPPYAAMDWIKCTIVSCAETLEQY